MDYQNKTREQLINELKILNLEYERLKSSYKKDISDRKQAADKLLLSEDKFRKAFVTSPDSVNINRLDDGMYITINNGFTRITGYQEDEVIGKTSLELNIWADPKDRDKLIAGLKEKGEVQNVDTKFLMKNGSIKNGMMSATIIHLDGVAHILSITRDTTEKKYAENALIESENKYRELIELAVDGILLCSTDGTIISANSYIIKLIGGSLAEILGMHLSELFDPVDILKKPIRFDLLLKGETVINERNILRSDGKLVPVEMHTKMMPDGTLQSIFHDITERKRASDLLRLAKDKAEASDRLKTEFLNNISHEVRTPLNGILGFAEIITRHNLSEADKKDSLAMLIESSERLLNTITNFMDISLITSGNITANKKDFNPVRILQNILSNFESACLNRNLELFLEIPEKSDDLLINSDQEIVQKILSHLLDNALKFTEKGSIHFGFNRHEDYIEFFVRDTGFGINLDSFSSIFDRFVKEGSSQYKVTEGSGLGLSIAQGMSEAIGGKIRLESDPGIGSCFFLTISLTRSDKVSRSEISDKGNKEVISGAVILVAEDDETNFTYIDKVLSKEIDVKILHASNGREAIELFKANPGIKLILMDIKMPEIDGFEATKQIKYINSNVPVIAITAYAMSGDEERIIAAGCDGYLSKPINKKRLLGKIEEFFNLS